MRIRNRLTLSFSLVAICILLMFAATVYYFSSHYRKSEFNARLKERIEITEKVFLEKENFSEPDYTLIQEQFLNKLPEEKEEVIPVTDDFRGKLQNQYPDKFLDEVVKDGEAFFESGVMQGAGRIFHINDADYLVLITAVDTVGIRMMEHLIAVVVVVLAVCILVMTLIGYFISGSLINPITMKIRSANSISASNLQRRLAVINPDNEMGELAIAFNKMLDRVEYAFDTQRLFIDNASHEIRNPLTAIMGETEYALEKKRSPEEYIASLESIDHEAGRLNRLVNDLLQLAGISHKEISFTREVTSLNDILKGAKKKLDIHSPENKVKLNFDGDLTDHVFIEGNRHLLITAFFNLIDNASKFSSFNEVSVTISLPDEKSVLVHITDHGIGISDYDLKRITVPFHRAANVRQIKGTGIGFPLTQKIIELHNGILKIESELNVGTQVRVTLPVTNPA